MSLRVSFLVSAFSIRALHWLMKQKCSHQIVWWVCFTSPTVIEINTDKKNRRAEKEMTVAKREAFRSPSESRTTKKIYTKHIQCWRPLKTLHLILIHSLHTMTLSFLLYMECVCAKNGLGLYFAVRCSLLSIFLFCFAALWNNTLYALFIYENGGVWCVYTQ